MGAISSSNAAGLDDEQREDADHRLIAATDEIFSSEFAEAHTTLPCRRLSSSVGVCPEEMDEVFGSSTDFERTVAEKLRRDIFALCVDRRSKRFTSDLEQRFNVLKEMQAAFVRERLREEKRKQSKAVLARSKLAGASSSLSVGSRLGIQSVVRIILILISTTQRHDKDVVKQILDLTSSLLSEAPILSMCDSSSFSPEVGRSIDPLVEFIRKIAASESEEDDLSSIAVQILTSLALARGSLPQIMAVVNLFLSQVTGKRDKHHQIVSQLKALGELQSQSMHPKTSDGESEEVSVDDSVQHRRNEDSGDASMSEGCDRNEPLESSIGVGQDGATSESPDHDDVVRVENGMERGVLFPSEPQEVIASIGHDWQQQPSILGINAAYLILANLDRISEEYGPGSAEGPSSAGDADRPIALQHPLSVDVTTSTLTHISSIIDQVKAGYFDPKGCADNVLSFYMYAIVASLRILKVHMFQFGKSGLGLSELGFNAEFANTLREQVFRFLQYPAASRGPHIDSLTDRITAVIQAEAAQAFAEGFDFFYSSVHEQIMYLTSLMDKRSSQAHGVKGLSWSDQRLLQLLLARFSSFGAASSLIDEVVCSSAEKQAQLQSAIAKVFSCMLELCESDALESMRESKCSESPSQKELPGNRGESERECGALAILQSFQKHLLARAGGSKDASDRTSDCRVALDLLLSYSEHVLQSSQRVLAEATALLTSPVSKSKSGKSGCTDQLLSESIHHSLEDSLIGKLCRPLLTALCMFASPRRPDISLCLMNAVGSCLLEIDQVCSTLDSRGAFDTVDTVEECRTVESDHPLQGPSDNHTKVTIPGAKRLQVCFDPLCCTNSASSFVQLLSAMPDAEIPPSMPLSTRFFGAPSGQSSTAVDEIPSQWPANPITVEGDNVVVYCYVVEPEQTDENAPFGFRIYIRAEIEAEPFAWLLDFAKTAAWLQGHLANALVVGPDIEHCERRVMRWMLPETQLLNGEIKQHHPSYPCVHRLIEDNHSSHAVLRSLHCAHEESNETDSDFSFLKSVAERKWPGTQLIEALDHRDLQECTDVEVSAVIACMAALLQQTGNVAIARRLAHRNEENAGSIPNVELKSLWNESLKMRDIVRSMKCNLGPGHVLGDALRRMMDRLEFLLCISSAQEVGKPTAVGTPGALLDNSDIDGDCGDLRTTSVGVKSDISMLRDLARASQTRSITQNAAVFDSIRSFCLDDTFTLEHVINAIRARRTRSILRLVGISAIDELVTSLNREDLVPELVRHLSAALHYVPQFKDANAGQSELSSNENADVSANLANGKDVPTGLHQGDNGALGQTVTLIPESSSLSRVSMCSEMLSRGAFQSDLLDAFFRMLSHMLSRPGLNERSQLLVLDLISLQAGREGLERLFQCGALGFLMPLISFAGSNAALLQSDEACQRLIQHGRMRVQPWNVRYSAWSAFRVLAYSASSTATSASSTMLSAILCELSSQICIVENMRRYEQLREMEPGSQSKQCQEEEKEDESGLNQNEDAKNASKLNADGIWSCASCTYFNDAMSKQCALCSTGYAEHVAMMKSIEPQTEMKTLTSEVLPSTAPASSNSSTAKQLEFVYESNFDTNGIIYYLGTHDKATGTEWHSFRNPATLGLIEVRYSSLQSTSSPPSAVVGRTAVRCVSKPQVNQWFIIDMCSRMIRPTHYTLRHYASYSVEALRNWKFEGSCDGSEWTCLREHVQDEALCKKGQAFTWSVECGEADFYSMFRIYMTGQNSNHSWYLALSGFEVYGTLRLPAEVPISLTTGALPLAISTPGVADLAAGGDNSDVPALVSDTADDDDDDNMQVPQLIDDYDDFPALGSSSILSAAFDSARAQSNAGRQLVLPMDALVAAAAASSASSSLSSLQNVVTSSLSASANVPQASAPVARADWWDTSKTQNVRFEGPVADRPTVVVNLSGSNNWQVVKSVKAYCRGLHRLNVRIDHSGATSNTWKIVVGVVPTAFKVDSTVSRCVGGSQGGWGYVAATGTKYNASVSKPYSERFGSKDIIGVILDLDAGTISFTKNGTMQGIAFKNLVGPVNLAVSFTAKETRFSLLPSMLAARTSDPTAAALASVLAASECDSDAADESEAAFIQSKRFQIHPVSRKKWQSRLRHQYLRDASVGWYAHNRADVGLRGSPVQRSPFLRRPSSAELELFGNQLLWVALRCSLRSQEACARLADSPVLKAIIDISEDGSGISRILSLRLCRLLLPNATGTGIMENKEDIVQRLLDLAGKSSQSVESLHRTKERPSTELAAVSSEAASVLRVLLASEMWHQCVHDALESYLESLCDIDVLCRSRTDTRRVFATLRVLRGVQEHVRDGARVLLCHRQDGADSSEEDDVDIWGVHALTRDPTRVGTVVRITSDNRLLVQRGDGAAKLVPISSALPLDSPLEDMPSVSDFIPKLAAFLVTSSQDDVLQLKPSAFRYRIAQLRSRSLRALSQIISSSENISSEFVSVLVGVGIRPRKSDASVSVLERRRMTLGSIVRDLGHLQSLDANEIFSDATFPKKTGLADGAAFEFVPTQVAEGFDRSGIIWFLGTKLGTSPEFFNPHELGEVSVTSSSVAPLSENSVSDLVGRSDQTCFSSEGLPYESVTIDFGRRKVRLSHIALRHWARYDGDAIRSFKLEGQDLANDGDWHLLYSRLEDCSLRYRSQVVIFEIDSSPSTEFHNRIRLSHTGPNSSGSWQLALGGIELYGCLQGENGDNLGSSRQVGCMADSNARPAQFRTDLVSPATAHGRPATRRRRTKESDGCEPCCEPGYLMTFGKGDSGRLGHSSTSPLSMPTLVPELSKCRVRQVSSFGSHVVVLSTEGKVYTFGNGDHGRLGHGNRTQQREPKLVEALADKKIVQAVGGNAFSMALEAEGRVFVWGQGSNGQMGDGNSSDRLSPVAVEGALKGEHVVCIGAGGYHAFAVIKSGEVYAWGKNQYGQLGINSTTLQKWPAQVHLPSGVSRFVQLCGGWDHSMALSPEGKLYTWGGGYELRRPVCGHGNNEKQLQPKFVEALAKECIVQIAAGWDHSMAVTRRGHVYCWGGNNSGSLGNAQTSQHEFVPCRVMHGLETERVVWVDGGQDHTCAVTARGELWTWGSGGTHLGHQDSTARCVPKRVEATASRHLFQFVSCGQKSNFVLTATRPPTVPTRPIILGLASVQAAPLPPYPRSCYIIGRVSDHITSSVARDMCGRCDAVTRGEYTCDDDDLSLDVGSNFSLVFPISWCDIHRAPGTEISISLSIRLNAPTVATATSLDDDNFLIKLGDFTQLFLNRDNHFSVQYHSNTYLVSSGQISPEQWHTVCMVVRGTVTAVFVDGDLCFQREFGSFAQEFVAKSGALEAVVAKGICGRLREVAYWDFALNADQAAFACDSGLGFVDVDRADDAKHLAHLCLFQLRDGQLPPTFELRGSGKPSRCGIRRRFRTTARRNGPDRNSRSESFDSGNTSLVPGDSLSSRQQLISRDFFMVDAGSSIVVPRQIRPEDGSVRLMQYTIAIDVLVPRLPSGSNVQAVFRASLIDSDPADVSVNSLGQIGVDGIYGGRRVLSANKGARVVITVDLDEGKRVCAYVDGYLSVRRDISLPSATTTSAELSLPSAHVLSAIHSPLGSSQVSDLSPPINQTLQQSQEPQQSFNNGKQTTSKYSIGTGFSLFSDGDANKCALPMSLSHVQIRDTCLTAREVRELGRFGRDDLNDGRSVKQVASTLVQMGHPLHWCIRALHASGRDAGIDFDRAAASDWIVHNQWLLMRQDEQERNRRAAHDLCRTGYAESQCLEALAAADNDVSVAISKLLETVPGTQKIGSGTIPHALPIQVDDEIPPATLSYSLLGRSSDPIDYSLDVLMQSRRQLRHRLSASGENETVASASSIGSSKPVKNQAAAVEPQKDGISKDGSDSHDLLRRCAEVEIDLQIVYARQCVLALLRQLPSDPSNSSVLYIGNLCSRKLVSHFTRLLYYAPNGFGDAMEVLAIFFRHCVANSIGEVFTWLVLEAIEHMFFMCNDPNVELESESDVLERAPADFALWILSVILKTIEDALADATNSLAGSGSVNKKTRYSHLTSICSPLVNLLFDVVVSLPSVSQRDSFAQLLSRMVSLGAEFDLQKVDSSAELMYELHKRQSASGGSSSSGIDSVNKPKSTLLKSLTELHLAICSRKSVSASPSQSFATEQKLQDHIPTLSESGRTMAQSLVSVTPCGTAEKSSEAEYNDPDISQSVSVEFECMAYDSDTDEYDDGGCSIFWDSEHLSDMELSGDDPMQPVTVQKVGGSSNWRAVKSVQAFEKGKHSFEIRVDADPASSNGWKLVVGVVPLSFQVNQSGSRCVGGTKGGWGYICGTGLKYHKGSSVPYGSKGTAGDTIGVHLDFEAKTIEFTRNGESQGEAFKTLEGPVQLAISMTALGCQVTIVPTRSQAVAPGPLLCAQPWDQEDASDDLEFINDDAGGKSIISKKSRATVFTTAKMRNVLKSGKFTFSFKVEKVSVSASSVYGVVGIVIGVVPAEYVAKHSDDILIGSVQGGWGYVSVTGDKVTYAPDSEIAVSTTPYGIGFAEGDVVNMYLDLDQGMLSFDVNGVPQGVAYSSIAGPVRVAISLSGVGSQVSVQEIDTEVLQSSKEQSDTKRTALTINSATESSTSLPKCLSSPKTWFEDALLVYQCLDVLIARNARFPVTFSQHMVNSLRESIAFERYRDDEDAIELFQKINEQFTAAADAALVTFAEESSHSENLFDLNVESLFSSICVPELVPALQRFSTYHLKIRLSVLLYLNSKIAKTLPLVDFCWLNGSSIFAKRLKNCRSILFKTTKRGIWKQALDSTAENKASFEVPVDLERAGNAAGLQHLKRDSIYDTVFGQVFQMMSDVDVKSFRVPPRGTPFIPMLLKDPNSGSCITSDPTSSLQQFLDRVSDELWSGVLPLFTACANGRLKLGKNRDMLVPRTSSTQAHHLRMFEFIGKLIGVVMRTHMSWQLDFPALIWKILICEDVTEYDVYEIHEQHKQLTDVCSRILASSGESSGEDRFENFIGHTFVTDGSDGHEVELVNNGCNIAVTRENLHEFLQAHKTFRLAEFTPHCEAMRRGLGCVVPLSELQLWTWQELQQEVCGKATLDVDSLKQSTIYENCSADDQHISEFWSVIRTMNCSARNRFVHLISGCSRFPSRSPSPAHFKIVSLANVAGVDPNSMMPVANSDSFTLYLPTYSSIDAARSQVLKALAESDSRQTPCKIP